MTCSTTRLISCKSSTPTWSLLRSPHAALILSFFSAVLVEANEGGRPDSDDCQCARLWTRGDVYDRGHERESTIVDSGWMENGGT